MDRKWIAVHVQSPWSSIAGSPPQQTKKASKEEVRNGIEELHVSPSLENLLRATANQLRLIKKREVGSSRVFVTFSADGAHSKQEICSDSAASEWISTDGVGVTIVPDGSDLRPLTDEELAALAEKCVLLRDRQTAISRARSEREQDRAERQQESGEHLRPVLFWKETDTNGYLSNFAKSPFTLDGIRFGSVEQYMHWRKAVLFNDLESAEAILNSTSPKEMLRLGRRVRGFKDGVWKRKRAQVQLDGARAKYGQNPRLAQALLRTWPKPLAEASPKDTIYGIGLAPSNPLAQNPANWKGGNLLGSTLETVREELRAFEIQKMDCSSASVEEAPPISSEFSGSDGG